MIFYTQHFPVLFCKRRIRTAEAWRGTVDAETGERVEHDISDTFHFLFRSVETYLEETERNFAKLVQKKRVLYSIPQLSA